EFELRATGRLGFAQPGFLVALDLPLDVKPQLVVDVAVDGRRLEQGAQSVTQIAQHAHLKAVRWRREPGQSQPQACAMRWSLLRDAPGPSSSARSTSRGGCCRRCPSGL